MANPQTNDGYTKIANEIMDALCHIRIPGEERQVLDCILRKTYGWNKCEDAISLSQFVELTGLTKPHISHSISGLLLKKVIIIAEKGNDPAKVYKFNKNYDEWVPLPKKAMLPKKAIVIAEKGNTSLPKKGTTKDTTTKDTITKDKGVIPEWAPKETFIEYQESRKKKLKPASFKKFFIKLKKLSDISRTTPEGILSQSIENGWEGIFELKSGGDNGKRTGANQGFSRGYGRQPAELPDAVAKLIEQGELAAIKAKAAREGAENPQ